VLKRILYLDSLPEEGFSGKLVSVVTSDDLNRLYGGFFSYKEPPFLCLDCRNLSLRGYGRLLKFVEEYGGDLEMIALDPVSPPILSRFTEVVKNFIPQKSNLLEIKLRNLPEGLKRRMYNLFGLVYKEEEVEEMT
jgi:hypothetical protein